MTRHPMTLASAAKLLDEHGLLRETIEAGSWSRLPRDTASSCEPFVSITYDTRRIEPGTLLFIKGRFRSDYLEEADEHGLAAYVAERPYDRHTAAPGLIVQDAHQAMALLSAAFYGNPERELTMIGITGTKGKTTTAYFTHAILNTLSHGKAALFSSVDNCLDGSTRTESDLTTPESLDAFRMMRTAVDNGMRYLVMEVSSQAYKVNRVYGITFDVGAFLNISPDHISGIEHPTFEDYLYSKRQLIAHSRNLVLGTDSDYADLLMQDAATHGIPVTTFALRDGGDDDESDDMTDGTSGAGDGGKDKDPVAAIADATGGNRHEDNPPSTVVAQRSCEDAEHPYRIIVNQSNGVCDDLGPCVLGIEGAFNYANAAAAIAIVRQTGVQLTGQTADAALESLRHLRIPGRMEQFTDPVSSALAIVDYAHNGLSVGALLDFVHERYATRHPRIILVTGSAGNKAVERREQIVTAAQNRIDRFVFTSEDTEDEPHADICRDLKSHVTDSQVQADIILDRTQAIEEAVRDAREHPGRFTVLLLIGKGEERWIKEHHRHVPYEGDDHVIRRLFRTAQRH